ncbi:3-hydroxybutyryl-CoA dehydratase [Achromobacter sp. DMS1]|nr:3-hydroxybutyryl-CoA dehydratase [Achromobacter sp. DMS1]
MNAAGLAVSESPQLSIQGHIATITLSRPAHANRLNPDDLETLRRHITVVNEDREVRVLRFLALGKYFCSGYDIGSLGSDTAPSSTFFGETMDEVEALRPVTIAVVQGGVYGGGTDLCLACDFRIGTPQADMFMPATRLGLHFYAGGLSRYVSRLGLDQAKRLFLTAERLDAAEMLRIGFLTELVSRQQLADRMQALSAQLAAMAPLPLEGVKKHLNLIARGRLNADEIAQAVLRSERSQDLAEGARAWKEKRPARFTGA